MKIVLVGVWLLASFAWYKALTVPKPLYPPGTTFKSQNYRGEDPLIQI